MNSSVSATEMLKLEKSPSALHLMKLRMSGWSIRRTPMFAPRRVPPCLTASVAWLNTRMNDTGPLLTPCVERTSSPDGRNLENENPVPPPDLWIRAVSRTAPKMDSIESSTGSTKHAESC